jgi:hypothetical protein
MKKMQGKHAGVVALHETGMFDRYNPRVVGDAQGGRKGADVAVCEHAHGHVDILTGVKPRTSP